MTTYAVWSLVKRRGEEKKRRITSFLLGVAFQVIDVPFSQINYKVSSFCFLIIVSDAYALSNDDGFYTEKAFLIVAIVFEELDG